MRKKVCDPIQKIKGKISVLLDESTTVGTQSTLIVYLKAEFEVCTFWSLNYCSKIFSTLLLK